jgi:hypothetical protein
LQGCSADYGQGATETNVPIFVNSCYLEGHLVFVLINEPIQDVDRVTGADLASI